MLFEGFKSSGFKREYITPWKNPTEKQTIFKARKLLDLQIKPKESEFSFAFLWLSMYFSLLARMKGDHVHGTPWEVLLQHRGHGGPETVVTFFHLCPRL